MHQVIGKPLGLRRLWCHIAIYLGFCTAPTPGNPKLWLMFLREMIWANTICIVPSRMPLGVRWYWTSVCVHFMLFWPAREGNAAISHYESMTSDKCGWDCFSPEFSLQKHFEIGFKDMQTKVHGIFMFLISCVWILTLRMYWTCVSVWKKCCPKF